MKLTTVVLVDWSSVITPDQPAVVRVDGLCVRSRTTTVVHDVTLAVEAGERVGVIGPSGSGKSVIAKALVGCLPPAVHTAAGSITVAGHDVTGVPAPRRPAAARLAMVFQSSATALNPMMRVRDQMHRHGGDPVEMMRTVGFDDPERILRAFPMELSGGQRQRVCIALALACPSPLLIADEPTTALDVITQAEVLSALDAVTDRSVLLITHDLPVAATLCTRLIVLERGRVVEDGPTSQILDHPRSTVARSFVARARRNDAALENV